MMSIVDLIAKGAFDISVNRRGNRRFTFNGESMCLSEASRKFNIKRTTLNRRLIAGWSVRDAITRPVRAKGGVA